VAAVLTPPDVFSQMMLAIPMIVLYELGIVAARLASRRPASTETDAPAS
jgi:sec-independent protein translocase protein TatC